MWSVRTRPRLGRGDASPRPKRQPVAAVQTLTHLSLSPAGINNFSALLRVSAFISKPGSGSSQESDQQKTPPGRSREGLLF